ncbi:MAG: hypothetical protein ACI92E_003228 [Oceanicoccus sp.]|jgi:hypothetical protein
MSMNSDILYILSALKFYYQFASYPESYQTGTPSTYVCITSADLTTPSLKNHTRPAFFLPETAIFLKMSV